MRLHGAVAMEGTPGGTRCLPGSTEPQKPPRSPHQGERTPEKAAWLLGGATPWPESLWGVGGSHHPCKHQVSIPGCLASAMGDIHLANIHAAGSQEQHQNPLANTNQIIYLLALSFKRQGKKDVKNMINLTQPKQ